jgi:hypothetical protein
MVHLARLANREPSPHRSGEKVPKADEGLSLNAGEKGLKMVHLARLANREPSPRRSGEKVPKADEGLTRAPDFFTAPEM